MSSTEQVIRVTAQGEFSQLQRGLKDLQGDLKNVLGEIDKGARNGGLFDDRQLGALDIYRRRFEDTMANLNREYETQKDVIEGLKKEMEKAFAWDKQELQDEIEQRQRNLNVINETRRALEQTYNRRNAEAEGYSIPSSAGSGEASHGVDGGLAMVGAGSMLSGAMGIMGTIAKAAVGLAGITSILGMATQAYQLAHAREVNSLDLAQRLRGNGFSGTNSQMYDEVSAIGRSDKMGYSQAESWQLQDAYTSEAGELGAGGQLALQKFSRGYGLDATTVGSIAGSEKQLGGITSPKQFADMIATSTEKSNMTPRILEVMKTNSALLQNLNTTFKDGSSAQILAYQTTLDRLGNENGMTRLTGAQGANVIGGLGGIYQPDNEKWKWMGITALQQYDPKKYSQMSLYDQESSFEDGIQNKDNIPAMAKYLKSTSGGNNDNFKRMMQAWLTDGGFKATKSEVTELDKVTNGFTAFDPDKIDKVLGTDSGKKYDTTRKGEAGQNILDVEAQFDANLTKVGEKILPIVTDVKSGINSLFGLIDGAANFSDVFGRIVKMLEDSGIGNFGGGSTGENNEDLGLGTAGKVIGGVALGRGAYKIYSKLKGSGNSSIEEGPTIARAAASHASEYQVNEDSIPSILRSRLEPLDADTTAMLDNTARETRLNRANMERAYRSHGDLGVDEFVKSGGRPPTGAVPESLSSTTPTTTSTETSGSSVGTRAGTWVKGAGSKIGSLFEKIGGKGSGGGLGGGLSSIFGFLPLALQAYETHKDNPNATDAEFWGKMLEKVMPDPLIKDPNTGKIMKNSEYWKATQQGDSDILSESSPEQSSLTKFSKKGTETLVELSTGGSKYLAQLEEQGLIHITKIDKDGTAHIETLSAKGRESLDNLKTQGLLSYASVETITANKFDEIKQIHQAYYDSLQKTSSTPISKDSDVRKITGATGASLNSKLKGKLSGHGDDFIAAGEKYGIDPAFLASISMQETGNGSVVSGNNVGGMMGSLGLAHFSSIGSGINAMASNLKNNYIDQGLTTPTEIQKKYAPVGAGNDPDNLNSNWLKGVTSFYNQMAGGQGITSDAFKDWQNRVTSPFHARRTDSSGKVSYHSGLDIAENQGTTLNALASGKVTDIEMDDGGQYDADRKANTRMGGTELVVTMPDSRRYSYSHLSKVNPDILEEYASGNHKVDVTAGEYLGSSGGTPGVSGSGYSTTGPHLHLGYSDANGDLKDPADFLKSLASYDTGGYTGEWGSAGKLGVLHEKEIILNARDSENFIEALDTADDVLANTENKSPQSSVLDLNELQKSFGGVDSMAGSSSISTSSSVSQSKNSHIKIDINLVGEGVSKLNSMTVETLKLLVQQGIEAYKRQQLAMNPTATGW